MERVALMARQTKKIFNVTEEQVENLNQDHKFLIEEFLNYLSAENKSEETLKVYHSNLNIFFVWYEENCKVKGQSKHFGKIKARDIVNFQSYMVKQGLSSSRIKNIKSALSSLSNFVEIVLSEDEDFEEYAGFRNIVNRVKSPVGEEVREKTILSDEQCQKILDELIAEGQIQKACVYSLAWASGRRKSELLRFKRSHIVEENLKFGGSLYKTPEKIKTKGKLLNCYILKSKFQYYFDLWMAERERLGVPNDIDEIFVKKTSDGWKPLKISTLNVWAEDISKRMNVDFYWHCLRHNFNTSLLSQGLPESVVQMIVGWSSANMVRLYDDRDSDEIINEYFNENGIVVKEVKSLSDL